MGNEMEDLRDFLDDLGGTDKVWKVKFGADGNWIFVSACALSVPFKNRPDRRVLFYIDCGAFGRGHAIPVGSFVKTDDAVTGYQLSRTGEAGM